MSMTDAIVALIPVLGVLVGPIALCFYMQPLDIWDAVRTMQFRQDSSTFIATFDFREQKRVVRGGDRYRGINDDVLDLMYPKRYWFNILHGVVTITAVMAILALVWRMLSIDNGDATISEWLNTVDGNVHVSMVLLAICLLVYVITVFLAFNQKKVLRRKINELAERTS